MSSELHERKYSALVHHLQEEKSNAGSAPKSVSISSSSSFEQRTLVDTLIALEARRRQWTRNNRVHPQPKESMRRARVSTSTISRIKQSYGSKASEDRNDSFISRFLYRPVSFYLTIPFVWTRWSANQVTLLRVPLAVLGTVLIVTGNWRNTLIGCSLYAFCTLLDYVDGNIARLYGNANDRGAFLDALVHVFERSLIPLSVAVGLCVRRDRLLTYYALSSQVIFLLGLFGSLTGFARTFLSLWTPRNDRLDVPSSLPQPSGQTWASPVTSQQATGTFAARIFKYSKQAVRLLIRESAFLCDAVGIVVLAALDLLSVFLILVAVQNTFVLRDEWGLLRRSTLRTIVNSKRPR
jgi:hypothetical protein